MEFRNFLEAFNSWKTSQYRAPSPGNGSWLQRGLLTHPCRAFALNFPGRVHLSLSHQPCGHVRKPPCRKMDKSSEIARGRSKCLPHRERRDCRHTPDTPVSQRCVWERAAHSLGGDQNDRYSFRNLQEREVSGHAHLFIVNQE